jgi:C4-dicarboxylate-specific signal transduction histidine kinase
VQSYRQLTRLPAPQRKTLRVADVLAGVSELMETGWQTKSIDLQVSVQPSSLSLDADPEMLEQILLNLLKNAEQALEHTTSPSVKLAAYLDRQGRVSIKVSDNGPGIADELASKIFVPFFTTKRDGSGVGLALTRQVMIAHGGTASLSRGDEGGESFTLTF